MIHLLLLYGANLGEFKGMGKGNIEKKHGVSCCSVQGASSLQVAGEFQRGRGVKETRVQDESFG